MKSDVGWVLVALALIAGFVLVTLEYLDSSTLGGDFSFI